jgi:HSP20 family protein
MDRLFGEFATARMAGDGGAQVTVPTLPLPINVEELKEGYRIVAPVPGFKPEEVEVTLSDGVLTIKAEHSTEMREQDGRYLRREVPYADYVRRVQLPSEVKAGDIEASFENGMLTVDVPRALAQKSIKVPIAAGEARPTARRAVRRTGRTTARTTGRTTSRTTTRS